MKFIKKNHFEYPKELRPYIKKAQLIDIITIIYNLVIIITMAMVINHSKIMATILFSNVLSLIPPLAFLVTKEISYKSANKNFPYGYHKIVDIAFFISALTHLTLGVFLLVKNSVALINMEHMRATYFTLFNYKIWLGYAMIAVLCFMFICSYLLGKYKIRLSKKLNDNILFTNAKIHYGSCFTALGGIIGIMGVGYGWWWLDEVVAILISLAITHSGFKNTKQSIFTLMDQQPRTIGFESTDHVIKLVKDYLYELPWVENVEVRFREAGHVYFGEALVTPKTTASIIKKIANARSEVLALNWKIFDFVITLNENNYATKLPSRDH